MGKRVLNMERKEELLRDRNFIRTIISLYALVYIELKDLPEYKVRLAARYIYKKLMRDFSKDK